jgi:hypothetical protein
LTSRPVVIERPGFFSTVIVMWGVFGVVALLLQAIWRLLPIAIEPIVQGSLSAAQALVYGAWVIFNAYLEGYRAFQKRFAPRVVARAMYLSQNARPIHVMLAPAFCMALFHARNRTKRVAWITLILVVAVVVLVRRVPQPWRGIVDGGVVVGLAWGVVALVYFFVQASRGRALPVPSDVP